MCVCVFPDMDEEKETLFGVPGQSVGSSQPSCHAVQGAVRYDWLRVNAAKLPPCSSSVHLLPQTYLSVCFYLSSPLLLIFYQKTVLVPLCECVSVYVLLPLDVSVSRD